MDTIISFGESRFFCYESEAPLSGHMPQRTKTPFARALRLGRFRLLQISHQNLGRVWRDIRSSRNQLECYCRTTYETRLHMPLTAENLWSCEGEAGPVGVCVVPHTSRTDQLGQWSLVLRMGLGGSTKFS